jgi:hypothetical protein
MSRLAVALAILISVMAGAMAAASAQDLSGRWYGEGETSSGFAQWFFHLEPDGAFDIEFRQYKDCTLVFQHTEAGTWSLGGDLLSTTATVINGHSTHSYKSYVLLGLEGGEMRYRHVQTGLYFKSRRVPVGFDWPACDKLSSREAVGHPPTAEARAPAASVIPGAANDPAAPHIGADVGSASTTPHPEEAGQRPSRRVAHRADGSSGWSWDSWCCDPPFETRAYSALLRVRSKRNEPKLAPMTAPPGSFAVPVMTASPPVSAVERAGAGMAAP